MERTDYIRVEADIIQIYKCVVLSEICNHFRPLPLREKIIYDMGRAETIDWQVDSTDIT